MPYLDSGCFLLSELSVDLDEQIQRRNNRESFFKTMEIIYVDISALCPRAVFSTIQYYIYI